MTRTGRDALAYGPADPRCWVPCWRCGGAGFIGRDLHLPCPICDTAGELEADEDGEDDQ